MLSANQLTEKIVVKRPVNVPNGSGGFTTTLQAVLSTFAGVKAKGVSNDLIAQGNDFIEVFEFTIRYRQDVNIQIADKVAWRNRTFEIIGLPAGFIDREKIVILAKTINETTDNGEV